ncbi:MAG: sugar transferase [candidate division WOR-3 bacterium]|nr:sugar transferase [candidate division WOR-3 bacterium]MCX7836652.1 sugar transferase [candidate division WOR-3 bacterium]MDW8113707.1 sugar transferase [candidate division WOR-3 bacterium]
MRKKRIIHILGGSKFGGIIYYLAYLIERQLKEGYEISILAENEKVKDYFKRNFSHIKIVDTKNAYKREISPIYDILALFRTIKVLKNYDIVHTHTSKGGFIGRLAAKIRRIKLIIHTAHGFAFHEYSSKMTTLFYSLLERFASYFCDKIIILNKKDLDLAKKYKIGNEKKLKLIYNGIDWKKIENIKPDFSIRERFNLNKEDFLITFVGRLSKQKNPEILIWAMKELLKEKIDRKVFLLLIGEDMDMKERLTKLINDFKIKDYVAFLDFIPDPISIIKASDCFVLPSLWEGMPIALLEAMASGVAIIASNIKGNNEIIIDGVNGLLFSPTNYQELKEKINLLIKNEDLRKKISLKAKEDVKKRFNKERFQEETMRIYEEEIIKRKKRINYSSYLNSFAKRFFDIIFATFLLIFFLPLFIFITLIQLFFFQRKVFFIQERRGKDFKIYKIYKFRTMKINAPPLKREDGTSLYLKKDPRITPFGKFLRIFGLDEIPQIINVLKGEMSIVGPRPDEVLPLEIYENKNKFFARPGLVSLAIVNGRNRLSLKERNEIEEFYVKNASFLLDLKIIFKTILVILKKEGIYNQEVCDEKPLSFNLKWRKRDEEVSYFS